jgi:hypothetical protein
VLPIIAVSFEAFTIVLILCEFLSGGKFCNGLSETQPECQINVTKLKSTLNRLLKLEHNPI